MRRIMVAANWKMNKTATESAAFLREFRTLSLDSEVDVVFAVPALNIPSAAEAVTGSQLRIAAQNMHFEQQGAYTGEISASMLVDLGVPYVVIGHSERRQYFTESDDGVNRKAISAHAAGIIPIICVGETLTQREQGITFDVVRMQVKIALKDLSAHQINDTIIAYEPIWAIGTGKTATSQQAEEVCADIRTCIARISSDDTAQKVRILYGGSVTPDNAAELFGMPNIDGGACWGRLIKTGFHQDRQLQGPIDNMIRKLIRAYEPFGYDPLPYGHTDLMNGL